MCSFAGFRASVARAEKGQVDADLGGGVIKQRIARPGRGKSGGYRTIIFFRRGERAVFSYGFAKNDRANNVLQLTEKQIEALVKNGDFVEVRCEQEISK